MRIQNVTQIISLSLSLIRLDGIIAHRRTTRHHHQNTTKEKRLAASSIIEQRTVEEKNDVLLFLRKVVYVGCRNPQREKTLVDDVVDIVVQTSTR